jgi:hypothetical protein
MTNDFENAMNTKQAAAFVGLTAATLAVLRSRGSGPRFHHSGRKPVYYASELRAWQDQCDAAMRQKQQKKAAKGAESACSVGRS